MRRLLSLILTATILAAPAGGAFAQGAKTASCQHGTSCKQDTTRQVGKNTAPAKAGSTAKTTKAKSGASAHKAAPKVGDSARGKTRFTPPKSGKLSAAPHGQEYRVADDRVVLVDSTTMKIVKVVGLLADLSK